MPKMTNEIVYPGGLRVRHRNRQLSKPEPDHYISKIIEQSHMNKTIRLVIATLALSAAMGTLSAQKITIKGSDTLVILAQRWAETYMSKNPGSMIQVTGGGSGVGISALINGSTDICASSRPMKTNEMEKLKQRYNSPGVQIKTAIDGVSIYLNESNPVRELTMDQIKRIYSGQIKNWQVVGGENADIILYGRENSSGTYVYFKDTILDGGDFSGAMQCMPGTAGVVNAVAKDKQAIGFGGAAYAKGVRLAKVKLNASSPGYEPSDEAIRNGKYPISRYLFFYTARRPTGDLKKFIDWVLSPEGQEIVSKVGYFPLKNQVKQTAAPMSNVGT